jgi:hypothetical protein
MLVGKKATKFFGQMTECSVLEATERSLPMSVSRHFLAAKDVAVIRLDYGRRPVGCFCRHRSEGSGNYGSVTAWRNFSKTIEWTPLLLLTDVS